MDELPAMASSCKKVCLALVYRGEQATVAYLGCKLVA